MHRPLETPLPTLLRQVGAVSDLPRVAGGGLMTAADVERVLDAGAVAATLGTAYLRCPEAGTRDAHRAALTSGEFTETVVTRAFSGRYARGLCNDFIRAHDAEAPGGYPEVNILTGPLRRAAAAAGDPHRINLWAGAGFAGAADLPAAQVTLDASPR
jgi:nitronate monooxygenase